MSYRIRKTRVYFYSCTLHCLCLLSSNDSAVKTACCLSTLSDGQQKVHPTYKNFCHCTESMVATCCLHVSSIVILTGGCRLEIRFITIPEMHHAVATSFSLPTTNRINLRTKRHRKCHKPEPVGIFYTVWYVHLFDQ